MTLVPAKVIDSPGMLLPDDKPEFSVTKYLESNRLALGEVNFFPPAPLMEEINALQHWPDGRQMKYPAAMWIHRVARHFGIKPQFILMVLHAEQSLLSVKDEVKLQAEYSVSPLIPGKEKPHCDEEHFLLRTNGGWIRCWGEKRMCLAAGAGIPDPGFEPPWNTAKYVGFDRQVYWIGSMARRDINKFNAGEREMPIYGGHHAKCEDVESFVLLKWTPNLAVLEDRPNIYRQRGLA